MSRYAITFQAAAREKRPVFCPFAVLGDYNEKSTLARIKKYLEAGADMLELGIPFSDPTADGPVIQAASERALKAGMTFARACILIKKIRSMTDIPIGILTYANNIVRHGILKSYGRLARAGADSILIADVPHEEILPFAMSAQNTGLAQIPLVCELTDTARLKKMQQWGNGYLYVTSTLGVTGVRTKVPSKSLGFIRRLKKVARLPLMVGFGVSNKEHMKACIKTGADGVIVGSALVKQPVHSEQMTKLLASFVMSH